LHASHHIAIILADLDGLKKINDTFGHGEGDLYLQHIATILKEALRGYDFWQELVVMSLPWSCHELMSRQEKRL